MNAQCPACGKRYAYVPGADFGCSPACRYDWTTPAPAPVAPALAVGDRVQVRAEWSSFNHHTGIVDELRGEGVIVFLQGVGAIRFGADALRVIA